MIRQEVMKKLDALYPDKDIYGEKATQNFDDDSFYVKILNGSQKRELNTRYKRTYSIDIHYFGSTNKDCEVKAEELYENMEYLLNNFAKGLNMNHRVTNGVLHFFVDYKVRLNKDTAVQPKFADMEVNQYGK